MTRTVEYSCPRHTFVCFRASAEAHLEPEERAVLKALKDARGFYRSSGLSVPDLMQRLGWKGETSELELKALLVILEGKGLAKKLRGDKWRRK